MSYNPNNVNIVDYPGFIQSTQTNILLGNPIYDKKVLAEGDSWFHIGGNTGVFNERNLLDAVNFNNKHTLLLNMALSGDTMARMSDRMNSPSFYRVMKTYSWNLILLSAGGNDLIDALTEQGNYRYKNKTLSVIQSNATPNDYLSFINLDDLELFKASVLDSFNKFTSEKSKTTNSNIPVVLHIYDFPTPRNAPARMFMFKKGPWLYKALKDKKVPDKFWVDITDHIFNALASTLLELDGTNNFHVAKTCGTIMRAELNTSGNSNDWLNEIHPNSKGIEQLAEKINQEILPFC